MNPLTHRDTMPSVADVNQLILESAMRHTRLRHGTGEAALAFRGQLFGSHEVHNIDEHLRRGERVDVLWFGSNPNVPESLENILYDGDPDDSYSTFTRCLKAGRVSPQRDGQPDFNVVGPDARRGWRHVRDALAMCDGVSLERVIMANAIPWGSSPDLDTLLRALDRLLPDLLKDVLLVSEELISTIVSVLRPRLILVPRSLSESKLLKKHARGHPLLAPGKNDKKATAATWRNGTRKVHYYTGTFVTEGASTPLLFLPHPAGLRVGNDGRPEFLDDLRCTVTNLLAQ